MPRTRRTSPARRRLAADVVAGLIAAYPETRCALVHRSAFELLVATILSAQCTDARVNMVTPALFARYPDPAALAQARLEDVEAIIHSTGFFRAKAKNLKAMAAQLVERHGGVVPQDLDALTELPGVGRKTAHVVMGNAFKVPSGVVVDTHVKRLSFRLGLTRSTDPVRIEEELNAVVERSEWVDFSHRLIDHGRAVCDARKPLCDVCSLRPICARRGVAPSVKRAARLPDAGASE